MNFEKNVKKEVWNALPPLAQKVLENNGFVPVETIAIGHGYPIRIRRSLVVECQSEETNIEKKK